MSGSNLSKPLTEYQQQIVDRVVEHGEGPTAIAEALGLDASNVCKVLRKPHVQQYLHQEIGLAMAPAAARAVRTMTNLLGSRSDFVKLQAAADLLDRAGFKAPEKHIVRGDISITLDLG